VLPHKRALERAGNTLGPGPRMKRSARRAALAAVVGLSLAHPSLSFQAQRAVRWMEPAPGWRGRTCCPALRPQLCAPSLPPAAPLGSTRLRMTATEPEAVGEEDEEDLGVDAAARRAEAEATACVSEVVEIMMGQVRASQSVCLLGQQSGRCRRGTRNDVRGTGSRLLPWPLPLTARCRPASGLTTWTRC